MTLRKGVARCVTWYGIVHLLMGLMAFFNPHTYDSAAYSVAQSLLPFRVWGVIMTVIGTGLILAGWKRSVWGARTFLIPFTVVQAVFASSIFWLTFVTESIGAFAGSMQWASGVVVAWILMHIPIVGAYE